MFQKKWKNPSGTRAYFAWRAMRSRCYNPKDPSYAHYGGRGIRVCKKWLNDYDAFYVDMGDPPAGMSLDRVRNNGHYTPTNCRWATVTEQLNNQRRNRRISYKGVTQTLTQWARAIGVPSDRLHARLRRMSVERALSAKQLRSWQHGTRAGYEGHGCRCGLCKESNNLRHRIQRAKRLADRLEGVER